MAIFATSPRVSVIVACAWLWSAALSAGAATGYQEHDLVSNVLGLAPTRDTNLRNPWGIAASGTSPLWVANNASGTSTVYDGNGIPQPPTPPPPLVVTMPPGFGTTVPESPTGAVFNGSANFAGSRFLFATEQGTIDGWQAANGNTAVRMFAAADGARYTGLAVNQASDTLFAADFTHGGIDVFQSNSTNSALVEITVPSGFTDPNLPSGYAPFNIQAIGSTLWVTYARVDPATHEETPGAGLGLVDRFDEAGNLLGRFASPGGVLNAPWGVALAPADFGVFSNAILIGNFGDGLINAFAPNGTFLGALADTLGQPIVIGGLWGLEFGNGSNGAAANQLYFAAGIHQEVDGLFGYIASLGGTPPASTVTEPPAAALLLAALLLLGAIRQRR